MGMPHERDANSLIQIAVHNQKRNIFNIVYYFFPVFSETESYVQEK